MKVVPSPLTPAGSMIVRVIAAAALLLKGANQCHSKDSAMPTHFFTIPLHEEQGVKADSIFQRNVMPDSFFMLYLIPLCPIPLYLIPVYCYAWFLNQVSLLCLIPLYHFLLYHIPLPRYNWFRYTSFCYAWFPLPKLCLIPLYHFLLCLSTLYQVPHPRWN